jgi:hypothetical protein
MENFEELMDKSIQWRSMYDCFLNLSQLEEWERRTIEDLILSEKVFDV